MLKQSTQQQIGSHGSVFQIEQNLSQRYPYKEIPFNERMQNVVYDSFGYMGLQRNIDMIKDTKFSNEERIKSLKLIFNSCINPDMKARAITQFKIVDSLQYLFSSDFQNSVATISHRILLNEWASKIVYSLASISTFKEALKPLIFPLLTVITGDIMKGSSTKLKHTTHYRDKVAAAQALHQFSLCHIGCKVLLSYDMERKDDNKILDVLIYTMNNSTSELLIEYCVKTVSSMCELNSTARDLAASLNIVNSLNTLLDMFEMYPISLTANACLLVWNVSLDGQGKPYCKDHIPKLGRVIEYALKNIETIDLDNIPENDTFSIHLLASLQYCIGAMSSILVFEESKILLTKNVHSEDNRRQEINSVNLLCRCLNSLRDRSSMLNQLAFKRHCEYGSAIERNILSAIKLGSELPRVRDSFSKILKQHTDGESSKGTLFDFVYREESHLFYPTSL